MQKQDHEKPAEKASEAAQKAAKQETAPSEERNYRITIFQVVLILVGFAFAVLTYFVRQAEYFPIDLQITRALQSIHFPFFFELMRLVSWPGYSPQSIILTLLIIAIFYWFGFHWEALMNAIAAVLVMGTNMLVKILVHRLRPNADLVNVVVSLKSYSFPSGHVMFYAGFLGFVWFLVYSLLKKSGLRTLILSIMGALIISVGMSRVYLGEHWTSDVVGAYLLGILTLAINIQIYRWGKERFFTHEPVSAEKELLNEHKSE